MERTKWRESQRHKDAESDPMDPHGTKGLQGLGQHSSSEGGTRMGRSNLPHGPERQIGDTAGGEKGVEVREQEDKGGSEGVKHKD